MTEKVGQIFQDFFKDAPEEIRPFIRSLVVTKIGAHQEKIHDNKNLSITWLANSALLESELDNKNKEEVLERTVFLATLPKHPNEEIEWYYRWLRGNGIYMLQDARIGETFNSLLDEPDKWKALTETLLGILSTDVNGLTKEQMSDVPESYSMFVTFLACANLTNEPLKMTGARRKLMTKAAERLTDPEVVRVMAYFGDISDTKELYKRFVSFKNEITLGEYWA